MSSSSTMMPAPKAPERPTQDLISSPVSKKRKNKSDKRIVRNTIPADSEYLRDALDGKLHNLSTKARAVLQKITELNEEIVSLNKSCQRETMELQRLELLKQQQKLSKKAEDVVAV